MVFKSQGDYLFEVSWEVCCQLGGIYTVIRSKAPAMIDYWGDHYCLIGPYKAEASEGEFERLPPDGWLAEALEDLAGQGITCHYGRWLVTGHPRVILIDYLPAFGGLSDAKHRLWQDHGIGTPGDDTEVNDVVVFGSLVERLFQVLVAHAPKQSRIVGHFHEWMGALAVFGIRRQHLPVATIFTTHATQLGRYICFNSSDFYNRLEWIDPDVESGQRGMYHRYCIERGIAASADVFTTVSEITAAESERLLRRQPDLLTPNGLRIQKFAATHEFQNLHRQYKRRIHRFVMGHFFGSYTFDLNETLYFFLAGRYEYRNKGMDVFLDALARLNSLLQTMESRTTVVAFLITKAATKNLSADVLNARFKFDELRRSCDEIASEMGKRLFLSAAVGALPTDGDLLDANDVVQLKRLMQARRSQRTPPVVTHDMVDDDDDPILNHIRRVQLFNAEADRVKIVYHPDFITPTSPLFGMEYEQFVRGCHLGVFPSYYEPWGYTPAECTALGIPSVTTDLSGFGCFIKNSVPEPNRNGIFVLPRRHAGYDFSVEQLAQILVDFCQLNIRERIRTRNRVEGLGDMLAWTHLAEAYFEAARLALSRRFS